MININFNLNLKEFLNKNLIGKFSKSKKIKKLNDLNSNQKHILKELYEKNETPLPKNDNDINLLSSRGFIEIKSEVKSHPNFCYYSISENYYSVLIENRKIFEGLPNNKPKVFEKFIEDTCLPNPI